VEIIVTLQSAASPALDALALALTNLGSEEAYIVLLVIVYLAVDARAGRVLGLGLLASFYLNQLLKQAFDTARPFLAHPELLRGEGAYRTAPGPAFPSGHAQSAATFWTLAAGLGRRGWLTGLAIVVALAIGLTRLYLGVHWPVDVLGGWAIGLAAAGLTLALARRRLSPGVAAQLGLFVAVPLALHLALPTPESGVIAGAVAGFGTAPLLFRHRPHGRVARRAALAAAGLAVAFGWLLATSALLPDAVKDHALVAPARYWILSWLGLVATPWAFARGGRGGPRRS
jgi:undecaprenyl-diphosphatase